MGHGEPVSKYHQIDGWHTHRVNVHLKSEQASQRDGSAGKGSCHQAWWPEIDPRDPHGRGTELTPASCPLTPNTYSSIYSHHNTHQHTSPPHLKNIKKFSYSAQSVFPISAHEVSWALLTPEPQCPSVSGQLEPSLCFSLGLEDQVSLRKQLPGYWDFPGWCSDPAANTEIPDLMMLLWSSPFCKDREALLHTYCYSSLTFL